METISGLQMFSVLLRTGSTHLTADVHSLLRNDNTIPLTVGNDPQSLALKIPKSKRASGDYFHLCVEPLCNALTLIVVILPIVFTRKSRNKAKIADTGSKNTI